MTSAGGSLFCRLPDPEAGNPALGALRQLDRELVGAIGASLENQSLGLRRRRLQTAGEKKSATFLSSMRQGLFFIPCIFILPHIAEFFGLEAILGIQLTQALCDMLAALCAIPFTIRFFRKMKAEG